MKKIFRAAIWSLLYQLFSPFLYGQAIELRDTLTAATGIYAAKPGTKSFYAQLWGGGAGGNAGWVNLINGYNGTGGGGGSSFSKTMRIEAVTNGGRYYYSVGRGGGINQNGGDSWIYISNQFIAFGGFVSGQGRKKQNANSFIDSSFFGGIGGQSFRFLDGERWQGGGGGSGRRNGDAAGGQNASDNVLYRSHGHGGDGTGGGGKTTEYSPGTPGGGGSGDQNGARGEIRVIYTCDFSPGTIGNAHTVPYPAEKPIGTDFIINVSLPYLSNIYTYTYAWEDSSATTNGWRRIPNSNKTNFALPQLEVDTKYRRVITNGCSKDPAMTTSNVILIKVFRKAVGQKDGTIKGRVVSKSGSAGVAGIRVEARKTINLLGSDSTFTYFSETNGNGEYSIEGIFYGDIFNGDTVEDVPFKIYPIKPGRKFGPEPGFFTTTLPAPNQIRNLDNFIDSMVYAINGRITQPLCASCVPGFQGPYGVGNVEITTDDLAVRRSTSYPDSLNTGTLGNFGITVLDPKKYVLTPTFLNHKFDSTTRTISVSADVAGIDFKDTSTREISGKLVDIAGRKIGGAILKFTGVYLRHNSVEILTYQKKDTIAINDSVFSLRLPAGRYMLSIENFTSAYDPVGPEKDRYIPKEDVLDFFNSKAIEPLIDINTKDSVRNLVYHRRPEIAIRGLDDVKCNPDSTKNPGIVFRTNAPKPFRVTVFEGKQTLGDRVPLTALNMVADTLADYIRFYTNITSNKADANADTIFFRLKPLFGKPMLDSFFMPGAPNSVPINPGDFSKPFEVHYIDRYGRTAKPFKPKATVVGVLNPTKTFTTAFPEIPTLILHAPPGDGSYSFWSKDSSTQVATSYSVAKEDGRDGFVNVSLAPTVSLEAGEISFEIQGIATLNYYHEYSVNSNTRDELVETITSRKRFETVKSPIASVNSGDVYIGRGTNFILGKSIYLDFKEDKPADACELDTTSRLIMAPKGFRTEFAYAEDHILNRIIPDQQRIADEATDDSTRAMAKTQVDVWHQVIENNNNNKKKAKFITNRSFSFGVKIDEEQTISRSAVNTITHDVVLGNNIAFELGFRVVGIGVSGGAVIKMRETTSRDTVRTSDKSTTIGYHLEDDDPGDYYSVDIKEDSVYGTPVFDLVAGTNSCPPEQGAQKRDVPQIISGGATFNNWDPNIENFFFIKLANKSESGEARKYNLSVDAVSAQDLQITVNGSINLVGTQVAYQIPYGNSVDVKVGVKKPDLSDKRYSFPNVLFSLADNCGFDNLYDANIQNIAKYNFNYASACGSIALDAPLDGWVINSGTTNSLPITMSGYTLPNIDSITLQYSKKDIKGSRNWQDGFTVKKAGISSPTSFTVPWNVALLKDTVFSLRLRMVCDKTGIIIYSSEASGVIDRKAPLLTGSPQPVSQLYNPDGNEISFTYNETVDKANLNEGTVELRRRSNNSLVPITVSEVEGKLVITPATSLGTTIDSFRVIVNNIADVYGNIKTKPDTSFFTLDLTPLAFYTGTNIATVHVVNPTILENSTGKTALHFRLREKAKKVTKIYFNVSGTALYNTDYQISYDTISKPGIAKIRCGPGNNSLCDSAVTIQLINEFAGSQGFVNIDSNETETIIYLDPLEDFQVEGDETIKVSLLTGPDYLLKSDSASATGTILNSAASCPQGNVLYVNRNATGNNSGSSWQNAMTSLKNALLSTCSSITQIWVAKGTYKPTINTNRDSAFTMKNNLAIYGGFAGTETQLSQRNWFTNKTILSGDIGTLNNSNDNVFNIVRNDNNGLNNTAIMDGFTITGGNANKGTFVGNRGGGVNNYLSTPSFFNCIITANNAMEYGGGMFNQGTAPLVVNSVFAGNTALYGGGLYNEDAATKLVNCSFSGNIAFAEGGAISTYGAVVPQITNSILWGNSSGIRNAGGSAPTITYSIVQGGYTGMGNLNTDPLFILQPAPGLANVADLRLQNCSPAINAGNNAALPGSISLDLASSPRIVNTTIDMGAYERQLSVLSTIIYVDINATGNNSGESWANAYTNLGSAITELNFCGAGTTILVAKGTYFAPVNATYNLDKLNASMFGGYPSGGGNSRDAEANPVIIRGNVQVLKSVRIDGVLVRKQ